MSNATGITISPIKYGITLKTIIIESAKSIKYITVFAGLSSIFSSFISSGSFFTKIIPFFLYLSFSSRTKIIFISFRQTIISINITNTKCIQRRLRSHAIQNIYERI